jgi:DNA-binding response OmpR family regulator
MPRISVVDDDELLLPTVAETLVDRGHTAAIAIDGAQAENITQ